MRSLSLEDIVMKGGVSSDSFVLLGLLIVFWDYFFLWVRNTYFFNIITIIFTIIFLYLYIFRDLIFEEFKDILNKPGLSFEVEKKNKER